MLKFEATICRGTNHLPNFMLLKLVIWFFPKMTWIIFKFLRTPLILSTRWMGILSWTIILRHIFDDMSPLSSWKWMLYPKTDLWIWEYGISKNTKLGLFLIFFMILFIISLSSIFHQTYVVYIFIITLYQDYVFYILLSIRESDGFLWVFNM